AKRATAKAATAKRSAARAAAALAAEQKRLAGPAGYTCTKLAEQAVMVSDGTSQGRKLIKVRATRAVTDNRSTYRPPSGTGEALVLSCRGTGIWSAGTASPVLLTLTVDAASDPFVSYREL
ncbi:MAG TPA: hypothetical protein VF755_19135, partial [Catenuloplanes sp.]